MGWSGYSESRFQDGKLWLLPFGLVVIVIVIVLVVDHVIVAVEGRDWFVGLRGRHSAW